MVMEKIVDKPRMIAKCCRKCNKLVSVKSDKCPECKGKVESVWEICGD